MAQGWTLIWRKHHRGLLVFLVGTLLLTMIQIASMYVWAGNQPLPEFAKHVRISGTYPFSAVWWLLLLVTFSAVDWQKELADAELTTQQRWRLMIPVSAALACWSATLVVADRTLSYIFYADTVTASWPLPLLGVTAWLIHFGFYWLASLFCLYAMQWPARWLRYLIFFFIGWVSIGLVLSFFQATNQLRYHLNVFLNRTPLFVLIVEFGAIVILSWWIQVHPLPVKQDPVFRKAPKPM